MLPMMGIMKTGEVSKEYFNGANMLLLAAMGVAAAAQVLPLSKIYIVASYIVLEYWYTQETSSENIDAGWDREEKSAACLHDCHHSTVHVHLQHRHLRHDGAHPDRGAGPALPRHH